ncbi:MAG: hypothetical protein COT15_01915 [Candidatus Diapherotrites archaeon CG08_land_8_20_14_0_20_34_12]|nr:MAG: hypothetical protein COT15_01915 [Candidatus Diapherotrites archaeon CG08_land_8_20_14_0_20_34_12]
MNRVILAVLFFGLVIPNVFGASLSLTLGSLSSVYEGQSVTLSATVQAIGGSVSNTDMQLGTLPSGLSTSDSLLQNVGTLSAGGSSAKTWGITANTAGTYTLTVTATGDSVSTVTSNATLAVTAAPFVSVSNLSCGSSSVTKDNNVTISYQLQNSGGTSTTITNDLSYDSSYFTLVQGSDPSSFDLNAGASTSATWKLKAIACASKTITIAISTLNNDPEDQSCTYTISGCPSTTPEGATSGPSILGKLGGEVTTAAEEKLTTVLEESISGTLTLEDIAQILGDVDLDYDAEQILALNKDLEFTREISVDKIDKNGKIEYLSTISLVITNASGKFLQNIKIIENIPKEVIGSASLINSDYEFDVLKEDPVIQFTLDELPSDYSEIITYTTNNELKKENLASWTSSPFILEFQEQSLCAGVSCKNLSCKENLGCNELTGKCDYDNLTDGISCGENKLCKAGKCVAKEEAGQVTGATTAEEGTKTQPDYTLVYGIIGLAIILGIAYYFTRKKKK